MEEKRVKTTAYKFARLGFCLMLCGPAVWLIPTLIELIGSVDGILAAIFFIISVALPAVGAVLCIISLVKGKEPDESGKVLSIITVVLCNPLFYPLYFTLCIECGWGLQQLGGMTLM
jgi:hypothetical protein